MNYTLAQTLSFFIVYSVVFASFTPLAAKFSEKFGLKHSVLLSVPFYLSYIFLLYFLPVLKTPLFLIGSLLGIALAFFWMGIHPVFYYASDHKHRGEEVGKRTSISIMATLFGPLVGGFLIKYSGFKIVFLLTSILLFSAALFLFLSKEERVPYRFSFKSLFKVDHWKNSLFFISRGVRVIAAGVIWPLLIFFILNDYLTLGIVGSVLAGVSAVLIWIMGKYSDHIGKRKIIKWVIGFESISWFIRAFVTTTAHIFGATIFGAVTYGVVESPLGALEYDKASEGDISSYFISREVFICLGRILVLVFVLITNSLSGGLIFNGVTTWLALLF